MSLLVVLLPPRERLGARGSATDTSPSQRLPDEWSWVLSTDGQRGNQSGQSAPALLPKADQTVLVLAEADVSWHRVAVPKAPSARLRAALSGVMEDVLLDDPDALHLALGPDSAPGREGWVAATDKQRLAQALALLESHNQHVERVVPMLAPGQSRGHFHVGGDVEGSTVAEDEFPWLSLSHSDSVLCLRLAGGLARSVVTPELVQTLRWTATPSAAMAAEKLIGRPVTLLAENDRALEACRGDINLRQFDLTTRRRGTRAIGAAAKRLLSAEWRPVRMGLVALLVAQLLGLNVYAWQQRQALQNKRDAMAELLKTTHPGVPAVLDAPRQMLRETERLRAAAGRTGPADLENLMAAAAAAWPDGTGPVQALRFEANSLTLAAVGWGAPQVQQFRDRLRGNGYVGEFAEGRVVVSRNEGGVGR